MSSEGKKPAPVSMASGGRDPHRIAEEVDVGEKRAAVSPGEERIGDRFAQLIAQLADAADAIEDRVIHLIRESAQGRVRLEEFTSEVSLLSRDLQRCYRQAVEMKDRRDLGFKAAARLQEVAQHCVWLYRRAHLEQAFFKKLQLETRLKELVSAEAFGVYQDVLDAEEEEKQLLAKDDAALGASLLAEDDAP